VKVGLRHTWGDKRGNLKPAAKALTRIISAGCFGVLQPIIKDALDSLVYACRGQTSASAVVTPAGEERRVSRRRAILNDFLTKDVNGGLAVGLGLFTAFAAIKADTPVEEGGADHERAWLRLPSA
jgi:hypothetical protein